MGLIEWTTPDLILAGTLKPLLIIQFNKWITVPSFRKRLCHVDAFLPPKGFHISVTFLYLFVVLFRLTLIC